MLIIRIVSKKNATISLYLLENGYIHKFFQHDNWGQPVRREQDQPSLKIKKLNTANINKKA
jgi:hypothetical protein